MQVFSSFLCYGGPVLLGALRFPVFRHILQVPSQGIHCHLSTSEGPGAWCSRCGEGLLWRDLSCYHFRAAIPVICGHGTFIRNFPPRVLGRKLSRKKPILPSEPPICQEDFVVSPPPPSRWAHPMVMIRDTCDFLSCFLLWFALNFFSWWRKAFLSVLYSREGLFHHILYAIYFVFLSSWAHWYLKVSFQYHRKQFLFPLCGSCNYITSFAPVSLTKVNFESQGWTKTSSSGLYIFPKSRETER